MIDSGANDDFFVEVLQRSGGHGAWHAPKRRPFFKRSADFQHDCLNLSELAK